MMENLIQLYPVLKQIKGQNEETQIIDLISDFIVNGETSVSVLDLFISTIELKILTPEN
jgi:hypothetical protein